MKTLLALIGCALVVIAQPKPYPPTGPESDSPFHRIAAVEHGRGRAICYWAKTGEKVATFHLELECLRDGVVVKTYVSREATVDLAKDPSGEAGATLLVAMANEIVATAGQDGYQLTSAMLLENCNMQRVEPEPSPAP